MYDGVEVLARIVLRQREIQLTFVAVGILLSLVVLLVARRGGWSFGRAVLGVFAACALAVLPATTLARGGWHPLSWPWQRGGCALAPQLTSLTPEVLLNTVMLAPFGLLAVLAFGSVRWVVGVAFVAVAVVEIAQTVTGRGTCQASDLVHNLFGAMVGAVLAAVIRRGRTGTAAY